MRLSKPEMINKRKSMDTATDPYLLDDRINGSAVCIECHAIFQNKRWSIDEELYRKRSSQRNVKSILCPACKKVKDNFPGGILKLKGDFLHEHQGEIINLIKNEEKRARGFNPLERIMNIIKTKKGIEITTTNEKLAQRIGKSLRKAYRGKIEYKWSSDTKLLRAEWER